MRVDFLQSQLKAMKTSQNSKGWMLGQSSIFDKAWITSFLSAVKTPHAATWIQTWQAGWRMEMAISHISNSLSTSGVYWKMARMLVSWVILSGA